MTNREQFIEQLRDDNRDGVRVYRPDRWALLWSAATWIAVVGATLWVNDLRLGWARQLIDHPRFGLETLSGLLAISLLGVLVFRLGVPGSRRRLLSIGILITGGVWLGSIAWGLVTPSLEFSMAGAREACRFETLVYALAPFLLGLYFLQRAYVLNWPLSATVAGVAGGLVPAWLMQLACVYHPQHILEAHLAPVMVMGVFAGIIGLLLKHRNK